MPVVIKDHLLQIKGGMLALVFRSSSLSQNCFASWVSIPLATRSMNKVALSHWRVYFLSGRRLHLCTLQNGSWVVKSQCSSSFMTCSCMQQSRHYHFASKASLCDHSSEMKMPSYWIISMREGYADGDKVVICIERAYVGSLTGHIPCENRGFSVWLSLPVQERTGSLLGLVSWLPQLHNSIVNYQ